MDNQDKNNCWLGWCPELNTSNNLRQFDEGEGEAINI